MLDQLFSVKIGIGILTAVLACGCSMVTKKSRLDRFLDGEELETVVVAKKSHKNPAEEVAKKRDNKNSRKGDVQLTSLEVGSEVIPDIVVTDTHSNTSKRKNSKSKTKKSKKSEEIAVVPDELRCLAEDNVGFAYRKRVGVLPMGLEQRLDVVDAPFIERQYSQELVRRMRSDALLPFDASSYYVASSPAMRELLTPAQARATAKQLGVQFVVAGRLVDLSYDHTETYAVDLVLSAKAWKNLARETYQRATDSQWRELNVELAIYDGPTGALIKQDFYKGGANQRIETDRYSGLDSNRFWYSDYGQLLSKVLNEQAQMIERSIECLPMRAQVVSASDTHIEINAGIDTLLMPGDKLKLFHRAPTGQVRDNENAYRWQYFGEVTIAGVFPMKSVAMLDENLPIDVIRAGDIVQAW